MSDPPSDIEVPAQQAGSDDATFGLLDLYATEGPPPKEVAKAIGRDEGWAFPVEDTTEALRLIPERDADLRRTRRLVHELADDRKLGLQAATFGATAISPDIRDAGVPWPPRPNEGGVRADDAAAGLLRAFAPELGRRARGKAPKGNQPAQVAARRAHNALLIATEYLSIAMGLSAEEAVPILREALGPSTQPSGRPSNRRRLRMKALTDASLGRERFTDLLEVVQPWIEQIRDSEERLSEAKSQTSVARRELDDLERVRTALESRQAELERELASVRQEASDLRDRIRDTGVKGKNEVRQIQGRIASHLESRVKSKLETAAEALSLETPRVKVANRMVEDVLHDLDDELTWLKSSD